MGDQKNKEARRAARLVRSLGDVLYEAFAKLASAQSSEPTKSALNFTREPADQRAAVSIVLNINIEKIVDNSKNTTNRDGIIIQGSTVSTGDNSLNAHSTVNQVSNQLTSALEGLNKIAGQAISELEKSDPAAAKKAQSRLDTLNKEAKSEKPELEFLKATKDGLIEATKTVTALVGPIKEAVEAVMGIIAGGA